MSLPSERYKNIGQTVTVKNGSKAGTLVYISGWFHHTTGRGVSWTQCPNNMVAVEYDYRAKEEGLPIDDNVLWAAKTSYEANNMKTSFLLHISEVE
jgi:hypothetical protein